MNVSTLDILCKRLLYLTHKKRAQYSIKSEPDGNDVSRSITESKGWFKSQTFWLLSKKYNLWIPLTSFFEFQRGFDSRSFSRYTSSRSSVPRFRNCLRTFWDSYTNSKNHSLCNRIKSRTKMFTYLVSVSMTKYEV